MKGQSKISGLYMAFFFGAIVLIGVTMFQADLFRNYGVTTDSNFGYLNKTTEVSEQLGPIREKVKNAPITGIAPLDSFISGIYQGLQLIFGVGDIYTSFLAGLEGPPLFIPAAITQIVIAIVMTIILFSLISIISNRNV